jgi:preprotein translocase subunit SecD
LSKRSLLGLLAAILICGAIAYFTVYFVVHFPRFQEAVDLRGGVRFVLEVQGAASPQLPQVIRNRIDQFGPFRARITGPAPGGTRMEVDVYHLDHLDRARLHGLFAAPGPLEHRLVARADPTRGQGFATREEGLAHFAGQLPAGTELLPRLMASPPPGRPDRWQEQAGSWLLVDQHGYVDAADIVRAETLPARPRGEAPTLEAFLRGLLSRLRPRVPDAGPRQAKAAADDPADPPNEDAPVHQADSRRVTFWLNPAGQEAFTALTGIAAREQRPIAIVLDRKVVTTFSCMEPISSETVAITGRVAQDPADAQELALILSGGPLYGHVRVVAEQPLDPSLTLGPVVFRVPALLGGTLAVLCLLFCYVRLTGGR